ncbi:GNAT family N-acetyltransferase [Arthrobacter citreus]|uniref:GNAT family N-acetyltransferase n=1 Tax=Arthrobacter citreus TaxID=1670 RepID=UPI0036DAD7DC
MNAHKNPAETYPVTIRPAEPRDSAGIRSLLAQMPRWETAAKRVSCNQGLVAVDDQGCIVGWLSGHHDSLAWENFPGYNMDEDWHCSFIQWLLVDENCRSAGIGAALMTRFARESSEAGRDTIIASPQAGERERSLVDFYYRLGYLRARSGHVHRGPWGPQEHCPLP